MLKVRDVMTKDVTTIAPDTLVKDAATLLAQRNVSGLPVMDGDRIVGIFTEADVLRSIKTTKKDLRLVYPSISSLGIAFQEEITQREILEAYNEIGQMPVRDVMTKEVYAVEPDISVTDAIMKMVRNDIHRLPVVDKGNLIGIVTRGDIIRGLARNHS
jgi:CBS domain-containing protein